MRYFLCVITTVNLNAFIVIGLYFTKSCSVPVFSLMLEKQNDIAVSRCSCVRIFTGFNFAFTSHWF